MQEEQRTHQQGGLPSLRPPGSVHEEFIRGPDGWVLPRPGGGGETAGPSYLMCIRFSSMLHGFLG